MGMIFEMDDEMLHPKLTTNGVEFSVFLSSASCDEHLETVISEWACSNGDEEIGISCNFKLSEALNSIISLHEMPAYDNAIDETARPLVDAMRAELAEMIARIDALKFASGGRG